MNGYRYVLITLLGIVTTCEGEKNMLVLSSPAFKHERSIPSQYTCDGTNSSPELTWSKSDAQSYALIMEDPDAPRGVFVHWLIANIPGSSTSLPANVPTREILGNGAIQGVNSGNAVGYMGPCPPSGSHRYYFKLYALDTKLELSPGFTKEQLLHAMKGRILAQAELMGTYKR